MKNVWLRYGSHTRFEHEGWFVFVTDATITEPAEHKGRKIWQYAISRHRDQKDLYAIWKDKNPRARKFENHFFTDRDEAVAAAKAAAETR